ncbi:acyltransferase [Pedobacter sp. SYSU D00535]|uniref:acyltransferase family protein n=1 Tax=Pedobacter sp. SYSU D00535 TaxID=2810308 RepID=UPI001A958673|nr:acyltransferase [Pedobacter sp. SYSU D00535]
MSSSARNTTVDFFRVLACVGVIAIHVPFDTWGAEAYNKLFWPLCVPYFYLTSLTYFSEAAKRKRDSRLITRVAQRILLPYLSWSVIYLLLVLLNYKVTGKDLDLNVLKLLFYGESAVHLYFLPLLFIMQITLIGIFLLFNNPRSIVTGLYCILLVAAYLGLGNSIGTFAVNYSTGIGILIFVGASLIFDKLKLVRKIGPDLKLVFLGMAMVVAAVSANVYSYSLTLMNYPMILPLGGIGLFFTASGYPTFSSSVIIRTLADASYGIYLIHIVFLEGFQVLESRLLPFTPQYTFFYKALYIIVVFFCSLITVQVLRKNAISRIALLGEGKK